MCGRYGRRADKQAIAEAFHAGLAPGGDAVEDVPSYNIAPTTIQPIIRLSRDTGQRELAMMRWGLVPFWAKDAKVGFSTINAKAETVATSPAFREAWKYRRCLVPFEWFYEWQKLDAKKKQPYAIRPLSGGLSAFAGLWETWKDKATGQRLQTYTIITTDPNSLMEPIHNRMPVILDPKDYERWMAPADPSLLPVDLLRPFPAEEMTAWEIGAAVGNPRNDGPELIAPLTSDAGAARETAQ